MDERKNQWAPRRPLFQHRDIESRRQDQLAVFTRVMVIVFVRTTVPVEAEECCRWWTIRCPEKPKPNCRIAFAE